MQAYEGLAVKRNPGVDELGEQVAELIGAAQDVVKDLFAVLDDTCASIAAH
ncbi:MAG TPA: hypothetical protein VGR06_24950 [Actinophytocola sp.]|uniref:hypothetical protein n=1 Tax=Actinophytocola sp. TaxID=1872138 RepID=UPI002DFC3136|nr:hypothetical protein [Actinophytocola sp.]